MHYHKETLTFIRKLMQSFFSSAHIARTEIMSAQRLWNIEHVFIYKCTKTILIIVEKHSTVKSTGAMCVFEGRGARLWRRLLLRFPIQWKPRAKGLSPSGGGNRNMPIAYVILCSTTTRIVGQQQMLSYRLMEGNEDADICPLPSD